MKPSDLLRYAVSGLIVGFILLLLITQLIGQPPVVFVESGSMAPTLEPNDGYLAVPMLFAGDIGVGDVILFESQELGGGELTTHRVVEITDEGYITKGDANPFTDQSADEPPVSEGQVRSVALNVGDEIVVIPGLGASVGLIRDGLRLFQETVLAPLGVDAEATSISTMALIGGLLLFIYGTVSGATDRYNRSRSRGGLLGNAVVVIAILTLVVIIPVNASMLLPSGVYQYEILSSEAPNENPQVIGVGESSDVTYAMRNSGFIPTLVFLEPASDGVTMSDTQIYLPAQRTVETSITMQAPDEPGNYLRFVREYRYLVVLPPSLIASLHAVHPILAIIAINLVAGGLVGGVAVTTVGTDRFRFRSRKRELELGDELRRVLPGFIFSVGGSGSRPEPPAPPEASPPPKPTPPADTASSGPPPEGGPAGREQQANPPVSGGDAVATGEATLPDRADDTPRETLTDTERGDVEALLDESPDAAGLDAEAWTIPLLQRFLFERYTVDYPREQCVALLQRAGHEPDSSHVPDGVSTIADAGDDEPRTALTDTERVAVQEALTEPPARAGLEAEAWTRPLLQRYLFETYGVDYPRKKCLQLLRQTGRESDVDGSATDEATPATPETQSAADDDATTAAGDSEIDATDEGDTVAAGDSDRDAAGDSDRDAAGDSDRDAAGDSDRDAAGDSDRDVAATDNGGWGGNSDLSDAQFMDVFTTLQSTPGAADIDAERWTPDALRTYLADAHGIDYTRSECEDLLQEVGVDPGDE